MIECATTNENFIEITSQIILRNVFEICAIKCFIVRIAYYYIIFSCQEKKLERKKETEKKISNAQKA